MRKLLLLVAGLSLLTAQQASASCNQSDLIGSWNLLGTVLATKTQGYWVSCVINVQAGGKIGDAFCHDGLGNESEATGRVTQKGAGVCQFTGSLKYKTGGTLSTVDTGFLSRDKNTATGAGFSNGALFTFTMLRI